MALSPAHRAVAIDLRRQRALTHLLGQLDAARVRALVIKGAALAHVLYEEPHLRERHDADLFIDRDQTDAADAVLAACGYRRAVEPDTIVAGAQRHYEPASPWADAVDLHWRVVSPQAFEAVLPFEDAWARSMLVPALGTAARTLAFGDALLLACVHRVAHHADDGNGQWLRDIDLLVRRLDAYEATAFVAAASRSRTRAVCGRGLQVAADSCGTPVSALLAQLGRDLDGPEPSAVFLDGAPRLASILASDVRHASWRERVLILRDHLLPSPRYMRSRYPRWPAPLLPLAYVFRAAHGLPAWLRKPRRAAG